MRIYVASSFLRKPDVRAMHAALRAAGHEITYDWTPEDASGLEGASLLYALEGGAARDLSGVLEAEVVVVLHDDRGRGMHFELGAAVAAGADCIVVGAPPPAPVGYPVFYALPHITHLKHADDVVPLLARRYTERRTA